MEDAHAHKNEKAEEKNKKSRRNLCLFHKNCHEEGAHKLEQNHGHNYR